ncbi:MAG TPA: sugar ABC transporter substrate-binding protein [Sporolactobacillaceae bacterium]|nr:sugar ABC transporter substrate-binding protein [Sporolactobacillaceae bacterium]
MRKQLKFVAILFICCLLLAGCSVAPASKTSSGSNGASGDQLKWNSKENLKGQTITLLWSDTNGANGPQAKLLKEFTKETGIKVNELGVNYNDIFGKVTQAAMSKSSDIDLAEMDTIWAGQYYEGNIAVDLTNVVPDSLKKQFTNSSISSVTYNGHLVAMPWYSSTKHFYWNKKLLAEVGVTSPPKTWDEFEAVSNKLKAKGIMASGWSWKQAESLNCDYISLVYAFGGQFFDANGKPEFNKGGGLKALEYMVKLLKTDKTVAPGSLQWDENDVMNNFAAGKIAMMTNWEGAYPKLNDPKQSSIVGQSDVGLMPGEGDVVSSAVTGSEGIAMMQSSKHKQAALEFLKWLASKKTQIELFQKTGSYPALQTAYSDPMLKASDPTHTIDKYAAQFAYGHNRPNAPGYIKWSDILSAQLHDALLGQVSPKDALDKAATQITQAIKEAK